MKKKISISLFIMFYLICFEKVAGQDSCPTCRKYPFAIALPHMFVPKSTSDSSEKAFIKNYGFLHLTSSKYHRLQKMNGTQDKILFLTYPAVKHLLRQFYSEDTTYAGVRIFFARFDGIDKSFPFNQIPENKVILLFCSVDSLGNRYLGKNYYYLNPSDDSIYSVNEVKAQIWIDNFDYNNLSDLSGTLTRNDTDNINKINNQDSSVSDTKNILYRRDYLIEAIDTEFNYEKRVHPELKINGFVANYCAYSNNGNPVLQNRFKQRLFLAFEYAIKDSISYIIQPIDLEDTTIFPEYYCRLWLLQHEPPPAYPFPYNSKQYLAPQTLGIRGENGGSTIDNGQLCPPSSNCPVE